MGTVGGAEPAIRTYQKEAVVETLAGYDGWRSAIRLAAEHWWALAYYNRAERHLWDTPFLDNCYAEVTINLCKAAEALVGAYERRDVAVRCEQLGFSSDVTGAGMLYQLRNSDDVAHAVISKNQSAARIQKVYGERHEKLRRAKNAVEAALNLVLQARSATDRQN